MTLKNTLIPWTAFVLGLLAAAVSAEIVLRTLPVCKGGYGAEPDASWPAHHLIPGSQYTFSTGWDLEDVRHGGVNNMGYVAPFDYTAGTSGVFVVGDSFIENQMNAYSESIQGTLPALLSAQLPVLGFGTSGATLPHDLGVATLIAARFKPAWAVVLITRGSFVTGFASKPGYFKWSVGPRPGIMLVPERRHGRVGMWVRDLSLVAYARSNLRADFSTLFADKSRPDAEICKPGTLSAEDERLLDFAARALPASFKLPPSRVVLVFDADRASLYDAASSPRPCPPRDTVAAQVLGAKAAQAGVKVIDMEPIFRAEYLRTGAHFDYLPVDGHWNAEAHALAAREIARYINSAAMR